MFATAIYRYFLRNRPAYYLALAGIILLPILCLTQLNLQEDITKLMPADDKIASFNEIIEDSDFTNRLVILIHQDTSNAETEDITDVADEFVRMIHHHVDTALISGLRSSIDEHQIIALTRHVQEHLPVYLSEDLMDSLASSLNPQVTEQYVRGIQRALLTPGASFIKRFVIEDPFSWSLLALTPYQQFQAGEGFELNQGYISTSDKKNILMFLSPSNSANDTRKNNQLIDQLDNVCEQIAKKYSHTQIHYFGGAAVAVANANQIRSDVTKTMTIAVIGLIGLLFFFYRSFRLFSLMIVPTLLGALLALGVMAIIKDQVSLISIGIGSILLGVTIDYALHLFTHHQSSSNIEESIKSIESPILISALTTSVAFMCLYFVRSEALHDLAMFAALSVVFAALSALIILPQLMTNLQKATAHNEHWLGRITRWKGSLNRRWFWFIIACSIPAIYFATKVRFEDNLYEINYMSDGLIESEAAINQITRSTEHTTFLLHHASTIEGAMSSAHNAIPLLDSLQRVGVTSGYASVARIIPDAETQMRRISHWQSIWTPSRVDSLRHWLSVSAQTHGMKPNTFDKFINSLGKSATELKDEDYQMLFDQIMGDYVDHDENQTTIMSVVRANPVNSQQIYDAFEATTTNVLDQQYLVNKFIQTLKEDFNKLVYLSLIFVFIILHITYGSITLALVTFIPVVLSWIWTLAIMYLFGIEFNIVNIILTTFIFGLGLDFSIFTTKGLIQQELMHQNSLQSFKTSILLAGTTTIIGIGAMIFAKHPALESIALIAIIGIGLIQFFVFTIQNSVFKWLIYNANGEKRWAPLRIQSILQTLVVYSLLALGCILLMLTSTCTALLLFWNKSWLKSAIHHQINWFATFYTRFSFFPDYHDNSQQSLFNSSAPAMIISNHASHIDTPILLSIRPNLILLTKSWVYRFPLFHWICRLADYYPVDIGVDTLDSKIEQQIGEGNHIALFPEGSRSEDGRINRFHNGAIYLAEKHDLDIIPIFIFGTDRYLPKHSFWGDRHPVHVEVGDRIDSEHPIRIGKIREQTKNLKEYYCAKYDSISDEIKNGQYYSIDISHNYRYIAGAILDQYLPIKIKLEKYYTPLLPYVPKDARILDIGCGYGQLDYILYFQSKDRHIMGWDYDERKIEIASHGYYFEPTSMQFEVKNMFEAAIPQMDVYILYDVLHYLPEEDQWIFLERIYAQMNEGASLLLRDGDRSLTQIHNRTRWTEKWALGLGFNRAKQSLEFPSFSSLKEHAERHGLQLDILDRSRTNSNTLCRIFRPLTH